MAVATYRSAVLVILAAAAAYGSIPAWASAQRARPQTDAAVAQIRPELAKVAAARPTLTKRFQVSSEFGDRDVFDITLGGPGRIRVAVTWRGTATRLAVILNGPGQEAAFARQDGTSPLSLEFDVTQAMFARGSAWRISVVNFGRGQAVGQAEVHYPPARVALQVLSSPIRAVLTDLRTKTPAPPPVTERSILPDGRVQVRYPDGRVVIYEAGCGTTTMFPDGSVQRALCNQVQPATLPAVPSDPALRAFLEAHRDNLLQQISVLVEHRQSEVDLYLEYEGGAAKGLFDQIRLRTSLIDKLLVP